MSRPAAVFHERPRFDAATHEARCVQEQFEAVMRLLSDESP
jgi:hypothetical protein